MMTSADIMSDDEQQFACLAVEMACGAGSVAACIGTRTASREYPLAAKQSRDIYTGVREVLNELELELATLNCIAFGCGPGAFTGLRVAAAVTQALAYGAGIPVVRVSSLAALAAGAMRRYGADCVATSFDARMGEAYLAVYANGHADGPRIVVPDSLVDPHAFRFAADIEFFAAGPGWAACPDLADRHAAQIIGADHALVPSAVDMLYLAARPFRAGQVVAAVDALPNYIRDKVTG